MNVAGGAGAVGAERDSGEIRSGVVGFRIEDEAGQRRRAGVEGRGRVADKKRARALDLEHRAVRGAEH